MHMVHTNVKYLDNSTEALQNSDGLAVVGVFFTESSSEDFEPFNVIITNKLNQTQALSFKKYFLNRKLPMEPLLFSVTIDMPERTRPS